MTLAFNIADPSESGITLIPHGTIDFRGIGEAGLIAEVLSYDQGLDSTATNRMRSHSRVRFNRNTSRIATLPHTTYSQSRQYNYEDGDRPRLFMPISDRFLASKTLQMAIRTHLAHADFEIPEIARMLEVELKLHIVRYSPVGDMAATSSPPWLHRDEERAVSLFLLERTANLRGGENLWQSNDHSLKLFDLQESEGLFLTQRGRHAVIPMSSKDGHPAFRSILLVTSD